MEFGRLVIFSDSYISIGPFQLTSV